MMEYMRSTLCSSGGWPILPAARCVFCACTAAITSETDTPS